MNVSAGDLAIVVDGPQRPYPENVGAIVEVLARDPRWEALRGEVCWTVKPSRPLVVGNLPYEDLHWSTDECVFSDSCLRRIAGPSVKVEQDEVAHA